VKGERALDLKLVIIERRAVFEDDLGDGVRQVDVFRSAGINGHDRSLASVLGVHQRARMGDRGLSRVVGRGKEDEIDRMLEGATSRDGDQSAVLGIGRIEARKSVMFLAQRPPIKRGQRTFAQRPELAHGHRA
jgi:hypothetical protein